MARVLIVNTGSSSLKWSVLSLEDGSMEASGGDSWQDDGDDGHGAAMRALLEQAPSVDAIGHRVVHGGLIFREAAVIDSAVRSAIEQLVELAPLHNPAALAGIDAATQAFPGVPQVAAFDTAFHHTIPDPAALYPIPRDWTEQYGLRRFGFHGLSVSYAVSRCRALLGTLPPRMVVCHLGAGCSVSALRDGLSVDTSMGFTPLAGLMMATRSGSVDPGLLLYLINARGFSPQDLDDALNHRSGLLGVSRLSADFRTVLQAADAGNADALLAYQIYQHRLLSVVGSMVAVLGGLDALVFTGGIGEHSARVRADLGAALSYLGLVLDRETNEQRADDVDIAAVSSAVRVPVISAREDLAILAEVRRLLF